MVFVNLGNYESPSSGIIYLKHESVFEVGRLIWYTRELLWIQLVIPL
jgi:hypothetical protein